MPAFPGRAAAVDLLGLERWRRADLAVRLFRPLRTGRRGHRRLAAGHRVSGRRVRRVTGKFQRSALHLQWRPVGAPGCSLFPGTAGTCCPGEFPQPTFGPDQKTIYLSCEGGVFIRKEPGTLDFEYLQTPGDTDVNLTVADAAGILWLGTSEGVLRYSAVPYSPGRQNCGVRYRGAQGCWTAGRVSRPGLVSKRKAIREIFVTPGGLMPVCGRPSSLGGKGVFRTGLGPAGRRSPAGGAGA